MLTQVSDSGASLSPLPTETTLLARRELLLAGLGAATLAVFSWEPAAATTQSGWRFCTKCRGLFLAGGKSNKRKKKKGKKSGASNLGVCPAGGKHAPRSDLNYVLQFVGSVTDPNLYKNFQQCSKCRGLFANDLGETGVCPAGGSHAAGNTFYELWAGATIPGMDDAWDECAKCSGLFNYAGGNIGSCPAGDGHVRSGSDTRYTLFVLS